MGRTFRWSANPLLDASGESVTPHVVPELPSWDVVLAPTTPWHRALAHWGEVWMHGLCEGRVPDLFAPLSWC